MEAIEYTDDLALGQFIEDLVTGADASSLECKVSEHLRLFPVELRDLADSFAKFYAQRRWIGTPLLNCKMSVVRPTAIGDISEALAASKLSVNSQVTEAIYSLILTRTAIFVMERGDFRRAMGIAFRNDLPINETDPNGNHKRKPRKPPAFQPSGGGSERSYKTARPVKNRCSVCGRPAIPGDNVCYTHNR